MPKYELNARQGSGPTVKISVPAASLEEAVSDAERHGWTVEGTASPQAAGGPPTAKEIHNAVLWAIVKALVGLAVVGGIILAAAQGS